MTIILPGWLLLLIFIGWACTLMVVWQQLDIRRQPWSNWRRGVIFGIQWGWRWQGRRAIQVTPYCTADETPLVFNYRPELRDVIYLCESCGAEYGPFTGDHRYVLTMIGRQIERRIADGSWRGEVEPQSPTAGLSKVGATGFHVEPDRAENSKQEESVILENDLKSNSSDTNQDTRQDISNEWPEVATNFNKQKADKDDLSDIGPVISKR